MKNKLATLTIFLGSMLLFGVQPMVGRTLLPFFGGTSAVWVVCLCSFQILLFGGYFYAHRLAGARGRTASLAHLAFLFASAGWAYFVADHRSLLNGLLSGVPPVFGVMVFLLMIVGLPYLALSANSSLVQSVAARGGKDVYRLYSVSNIGSFVGLFLYPFVLEPFVSVGGQWRIFAAGLAVYAALLFVCLVGHDGAAGVRALPAEDGATAPETRGTKHGVQGAFLWIFLPALSCAILNAVTAHLTLNVLALPLLWCLLLALFLLTYIVGFAGFAGRYLPLWDGLALTSAAIIAISTAAEGSAGFCWQLIGGCGIVLFGGIALHVRLYEIRPEPAILTRYYLYGALGGGLGGVLTGLVAPLVFKSVMEFPIVFFALVITLVLLRNWKRPLMQVVPVVFGIAVLAVFLFRLDLWNKRIGDTIFADRGFFGTVRVTSCPARTSTAEGTFHQYWHGTTLHCGQFIAPGYGLRPTLYHAPHGGGFAILSHPKYGLEMPMRVGIVGMGMGVSCAYGRTNDVYRCWEISPEALNIATNGQYFTFAAESAAKVETVLGDARMALEEERRVEAPQYDVLQIDAFSGDSSAPYHLCTEEAFQLYLDRLAPGGFLSMHISNWHMDLLPLAKAVAIKFGLHTLVYTPNEFSGENPCKWVLMMRSVPKGFQIPDGISVINLKPVLDWALPTDEKGSLIDLIRFDD